MDILLLKCWFHVSLTSNFLVVEGALECLNASTSQILGLQSFTIMSDGTRHPLPPAPLESVVQGLMLLRQVLQQLNYILSLNCFNRKLT